MRKRIFYETRIYDYADRADAKAHAAEMVLKGWYPNHNGKDGAYRPSGIYENGNDTMPYSIEYFRQH